MSGAAERWRTLEHTADLAVEVEAASLERLFAMAAHAMTGVTLGQEEGESAAISGKIEAWRDFDLEASDREALLVEWLRELLYVELSEGLVLVSADIEQLEDERLIGRAGFATPPAGVAVERELKGVTYHDLRIERRGDAWFARVVFDL